MPMMAPRQGVLWCRQNEYQRERGAPLCAENYAPLINVSVSS